MLLRFLTGAESASLFERTATLVSATCLLSACMLQRTEDLSSATTAPADRATLQCGGVCGVISNIDTDQSYGVAYEEGLLMNEGVGDVILDPGSYLVSVLTHGKYTPWGSGAIQWLCPLHGLAGSRLLGRAGL
jgi:hypothetical protein